MDLLSAMATFVRVVNAGSLSKAARALKVTPAAISRQLTALEAELGATLLVRTTRQVSVTEEGRRFYEHAERTVNEAEEARASVRHGRAISGNLVVSMPTALALSGLDTRMAELSIKNPGLRVDLRLEDQPVDLLADGIDAAIRAGLVPPDSMTLVAQPLVHAPRVVVAAPSYLKKRGEPRSPEELPTHDVLVHLHAGAGVGVWQLYAEEDRAIRMTVQGPFRATALVALRNAAVAGAGIALLPRFVVEDDLAAKRLRVLALGGWAPRGQDIYALLRAESKDRARVRAFLAEARTYLSALVATA